VAYPLKYAAVSSKKWGLVALSPMLAAQSVASVPNPWLSVEVGHCCHGENLVVTGRKMPWMSLPELPASATWLTPAETDRQIAGARDPSW
jgi:hypothetical protein